MCVIKCPTWFESFFFGGNSDPVHSFSLFFWPRNWWKTTTSSPLKCRSRRYGTCPSAGPFASRSEQQNPTTGGCNGRCLSKRGDMELPKPKANPKLELAGYGEKTQKLSWLSLLLFFLDEKDASFFQGEIHEFPLFRNKHWHISRTR